MCDTHRPGYTELLKQNYPLPSLRTLRRKVQGLTFQSGVLDEVFRLLQIKVNSMTANQQKDCCLVLDEMAITRGLEFDLSSQSLVGYVTLPGHSGLASKALVFMLGGIGSRWKQIVAYYYTGDIIVGSVLVPIINELVTKAEAIGLHVVCITSDMAPANQSMWNTYGITVGRYSRTRNSIAHPCDPTRPIFILADVPHLYKNIKSTLCNNKKVYLSKDIQEKFNLPTNEILTQHIKDLCDHQNEHELKLACKLSHDNLETKHFDKMKVGNTKSVLSHDVGAALEYLVESGNMDLAAKTTAWFIKLVYKWFDLCSSRHPVLALSKVNMTKFEETITFLKLCIDVFQSLKFGEKGHWKPCQSGLILTTWSIIHLQELLLDVKGYKFVLTSRFSQDCLENLFSSIRGIHPLPNALLFKNNLKLICTAQYLRYVSSGNYEEDDRQFLGDFLEPLKSGNIVPSHNEQSIHVPANWSTSSI